MGAPARLFLCSRCFLQVLLGNTCDRANATAAVFAPALPGVSGKVRGLALPGSLLGRAAGAAHSDGIEHRQTVPQITSVTHQGDR